MKYHVVYAVIALVTFVGHLLSNVWTETLFYLPEYIWFISIIFSALAIYGGTITASRPDADKRGVAIASAMIGSIVLLGLLYSGVFWLFGPQNGAELMY